MIRTSIRRLWGGEGRRLLAGGLQLICRGLGRLGCRGRLRYDWKMGIMGVALGGVEGYSIDEV